MTVKFPLCYSCLLLLGGGGRKRKGDKGGKVNYVTCKETVEDVAEF